jgi:hypothetical protein
MTIAIFEESKLTLRVSVTSGEPTGNKATFKFLVDGQQHSTKDVPLSAQSDAVCELDVPKVADDKDSYLLTYEVTTADKRHWEDQEDYRVWPKKVTVKAIQSVNGTEGPCKGFRFEVDQTGAAKKAWRTVDGGTVEATLDKPAAFTLKELPPYKLLEWTKTTGRNREAKVERVTEAEIFAPEPPTSGSEIKQYVNLVTSTDGQDGLGNIVTFVVGAKGDKGKDPANRLGEAGMEIFVKVELDGANSARNVPKPALLDAQGIVASNGNKTYTGKVVLGADGEPAKFRVELGQAGGDKCKVSVGGTSACGDDKRELVNWRKLHYELMYPDFMAADLDDGTTDDGATAKDYPAAITSAVKTKLDPVFIEFKLLASHEFPGASATAGTLFTKEYLGATSGRDDRLVLGGTLSSMYPVPFSSPQRDTCVQVRLCDAAYGTKETSAGIAYDTHSPQVTSVTETVDIGGPLFAKCFSTNATAISTSGFAWVAKVTPANHLKAPTMSWATPDQPDTTGAQNAVVVLTERTQGRTHTITFSGGVLHRPTDLGSTQKQALEQFVRGLLAGETVMRRNGNKVEFSIVAEWGNDRRQKRFDNVKALVGQYFDAHKKSIAMHPGLDDAGQPRRGAADSAWIVVKTLEAIEVTLPTGGTPTAPLPGDLVGPLSDTKCPIRFSFKIARHYGINGNSGGGRQVMVLKTANPTGCAETVCHELGHSMGMTVMAGKSENPPGMPAAKHVDDGGCFYVNGTPPGGGKRDIHKGGHCATGLADMTVMSYAGLKGTCILWGAGGVGITRDAFCDTCKKYIKARKLTNIRSAWASRTPAES